jgi:hypothetical protein
MPRRKVTKSYQISTRTPSARKAPGGGDYIPPMNKPKARSKLLDYVETRREDRPEASTQELIVEFQEEVCDHPSWRDVARSPEKTVRACTVCNMVKVGK